MNDKQTKKPVKKLTRIAFIAFALLWMLNILISFYLYNEVVTFTSPVVRDPAIARPPISRDPSRTPEDSAHIKRVTVLVVLNAPSVAVATKERKAPVSSILKALAIVIGAVYIPAGAVTLIIITIRDRATQQKHGWNPTTSEEPEA
jgi:hypothetical protein